MAGADHTPGIKEIFNKDAAAIIPKNQRHPALAAGRCLPATEPPASLGHGLERRSVAPWPPAFAPVPPIQAGHGPLDLATGPKSALFAQKWSFARLEAKLQELEADLAGRQRTLTELEADLAGRQRTLAEPEADLAGRQRTLTEPEADLGGRQRTLTELEVDLVGRQRTLAELEAHLPKRRKTLAERRDHLPERRKPLAGLQMRPQDRRRTPAGWRNRLPEHGRTVVGDWSHPREDRVMRAGFPPPLPPRRRLPGTRRDGCGFSGVPRKEAAAHPGGGHQLSISELMKPLTWDAINPFTGKPFTWDDKNLRWGSPSYYLEPGDPGFQPYPDAIDTQSSNPRFQTKIKKMKHNSYYPTNVPAQIIWLTNFYNKLINHATTLGISPGDAGAIVADARWLIYLLGTYLPAQRVWAKSNTDFMKDAQFGTGASAMTLPAFTSPPLPAADAEF